MPGLAQGQDGRLARGEQGAMAVVRVINCVRLRTGANPNPDDHRTPAASTCSGVERTAPKFWDLQGWSLVPTIPAVPRRRPRQWRLVPLSAVNLCSKVLKKS
jgi:hypothetical protein